MPRWPQRRLMLQQVAARLRAPPRCRRVRLVSWPAPRLWPLLLAASLAWPGCSKVTNVRATGNFCKAPAGKLLECSTFSSFRVAISPLAITCHNQMHQALGPRASCRFPSHHRHVFTVDFSTVYFLTFLLCSYYPLLFISSMTSAYPHTPLRRHELHVCIQTARRQ